MSKIWHYINRYRNFISFSWVKRKPIRILLVVLRIYVVVGIILYFAQSKVIFQPGMGSWDSCPELLKNGAVTVDETLGERTVRSWYIPNRNAEGRIYIFHGNAKHACDRYFWTLFLPSAELEVVFVEYPGYDGTQLTYELLIQRGLDVFDVFQARKKLPSVAIGESLGTGLATYLASERNLNGLVLYASYPSLVEVAQAKLKIYPVTYILNFPIPAETWAKKIEIPVLSIHGEEDSVIPYSLGKRQTANFSNASLVNIPGANHNDWLGFVDGSFVLRMKKFILENLQQ